MAVNAYITLSQNQAISGQTMWGNVQVVNNTSVPVTVSSISVCAPPSAAVCRIDVNLGAGAGGAAATVPAGVSTINAGVSYSYPFAVQGFGARKPGATPINIPISGTVGLSDGTQVAAQVALINIVPALQSTADTVNTQVSNTSTNLALVLGLPAGLQFMYPNNSGLIDVLNM